MRYAKCCVLAACGVLLGGVSVTCAATNLPLGQVTTGAVAVSSGVSLPVRYSLTGVANEVVVFTLVGTSGALIPEIQLYNPGGTLVASNYAGSPFSCSGTVVSLGPTQLTTAGTYTVLVTDCVGTNGGNFSLYAQSTNSPGGTVGTIDFGLQETGDVASVAWSDTYTFSATSGDEVDLRLDATSGTLIPAIRIYNPSGTLLDSSYSGSPFSCSGTGVGINPQMIPTTGTYTVLINDCTNVNTGNYELYVQRTNNAGGTIVPLVFDQVQTGTIGTQTQSNTYTFTAAANDAVLFQVDTTSGALIPAITVYNPSGTIAASNYSGSPFSCSGTQVPLTTPALAAAGTYTVLVGDCDTTNSGNYDIYSERVNNSPPGAASLSFGKAVSGMIGSETQRVPYTFNATAKDVIDFTMVTTNGSLIPAIEVFNPNGTLLASNYSGSPFSCGGTGVELNSVSIPATGTYAVLVYDCSTTNTGNYELYAQRTNNPAAASAVLWGQVQTGNVGVAAQNATYTFTGSSGNTVDFTLNGTTQGSSFIPKIRIYKPDGSALASNYSGSPFSCSGTGTSLNSVSLSQNGTYTVLIADCTDTNTGNFSLVSQCFGTCPLPAPVLASIAPTSALIGSSCPFTLTVKGSNFVNQYANSVVQWDGADLSTTFVSTSELTAQVPCAELTAAGMFPITVYTPPAGGGTSKALNFTVNNPVPTATSLSPASQPEGAPSFTLTVTGTNFLTGSVVQWNGASLATAFVSATELQATVPSSDIPTPGTAQVTVFNPGPGGGTSSPALTFTIVQVITWANPAAITYGTPLGSKQLDATSTIPGTLTYSPAAGTILQAGEQMLCVSLAPTSPSEPPAKDCVTLTVNQAPVPVSWPAPAAILYGTPLSATQLDASSGGVAGSFTYTPPAGTVLKGGTHVIWAQFAPTDSTDYKARGISTSIVVDPATPVLTWATPAPLTYGRALGPMQLDAKASVPGTFVYSPAAGTILSAGTQNLSVTFTPSDKTDYTTAATTVMLTVNQAPVPVSWPAPAPITYGTPLSATQLDASSGGVAGTFTYTPPAGTVLKAGSHVLWAQFAPTDSTDYKARGISTTIVVNQAVPVLTWATPAAITYGRALNAIQLDAKANVPGTLVYSPVAGTILTAGTHTLSVTLTPSDKTDYTTTTTAVMLTVNQAPVPVSWPAPAPITYGTPLSATQLDASSGGVAGTFTYTPPAGTVLKAGSHILWAAFMPADSTDYKARGISTTLVVNAP